MAEPVIDPISTNEEVSSLSESEKRVLEGKLIFHQIFKDAFDTSEDLSEQDKETIETTKEMLVDGFGEQCDSTLSGDKLEVAILQFIKDDLGDEKNSVIDDTLKKQVAEAIVQYEESQNNNGTQVKTEGRKSTEASESAEVNVNDPNTFEEGEIIGHEAEETQSPEVIEVKPSGSEEGMNYPSGNEVDEKYGGVFTDVKFYYADAQLGKTHGPWIKPHMRSYDPKTGLIEVRVSTGKVNGDSEIKAIGKILVSDLDPVLNNDLREEAVKEMVRKVSVAAMEEEEAKEKQESMEQEQKDAEETARKEQEQVDKDSAAENQQEDRKKDDTTITQSGESSDEKVSPDGDLGDLGDDAVTDDNEHVEPSKNNKIETDGETDPSEIMIKKGDIVQGAVFESKKSTGTYVKILSFDEKNNEVKARVNAKARKGQNGVDQIATFNVASLVRSYRKYDESNMGVQGEDIDADTDNPIATTDGEDASNKATQERSDQEKKEEEMVIEEDGMYQEKNDEGRLVRVTAVNGDIVNFLRYSKKNGAKVFDKGPDGSMARSLFSEKYKISKLIKGERKEEKSQDTMPEGSPEGTVEDKDKAEVVIFGIYKSVWTHEGTEGEKIMVLSHDKKTGDVQYQRLTRNDDETYEYGGKSSISRKQFLDDFEFTGKNVYDASRKQDDDDRKSALESHSKKWNENLVVNGIYENERQENDVIEVLPPGENIDSVRYRRLLRQANGKFNVDRKDFMSKEEFNLKYKYTGEKMPNTQKNATDGQDKTPSTRNESEKENEDVAREKAQEWLLKFSKENRETSEVLVREFSHIKQKYFEAMSEGGFSEVVTEEAWIDSQHRYGEHLVDTYLDQYLQNVDPAIRREIPDLFVAAVEDVRLKESL